MMVILREMARTDEIIPPLMKNMHPKDRTNAQAFFYDINKTIYMVARGLGRFQTGSEDLGHGPDLF